MNAERRILNFIQNTSIALFYVAIIFGFITTPLPFALGILAGGLLVTVNFHLMYRSLREALTPPHTTNVASALTKHFLRFTASVIIITALIAGGYVHPGGLIVGLSVIVAAFMLAALRETLRILFK
jgi:hypothetical protein